jgi:2-oxoglutarate dehydrogenase E2 component (dihydrolipoamide succinyltransferase)
MANEKPNAPRLIEITVPELELDALHEITVSCWLVSVGDEVFVGDRVVELLCGDLTFDVASPASGRLVRITCEPDDVVTPGVVLGHIQFQEADLC